MIGSRNVPMEGIALRTCCSVEQERSLALGILGPALYLYDLECLDLTNSFLVRLQPTVDTPWVCMSVDHATPRARWSRVVDVRNRILIFC